MAGDVTVEQPEAFRVFASEIRALRETLQLIGARRPTEIDLLSRRSTYDSSSSRSQPGPVPGWPFVDLTDPAADLWRAADGAIERLGEYATAAHRGLTGLAMVSDSVGTLFPAADAAGRRRLSRLVDDAVDTLPEPSAAPQDPDPRFVPPSTLRPGK